MGAARVKLKAYPVSPQPSKGIFFTMDTNYLEQIEDALINAAIEKQIELERKANHYSNDHITILEQLLRQKRKYWIKRGLQLFDNNLPFNYV